MKLDVDLVREILLMYEQTEATSIYRKEFQIPAECSKEKFDFHLKILEEAGFLQEDIAQLTLSSVGITSGVRPTWQGYQLLDDIRDPEVWRKTKAGAQKVGSFSFDVLKAIAKGIVKKKIRELSDIDVDF